MVYQATRPTQVAIGQRRAPRPEGRPGYLRVDTVHQGDWDGAKGVYHVNAVDEVTQWQVVGAAGQITEAALRPVLEAMLEQFPLRIRGFHSDNGSEFINHTVAGLLNKLLIEQTKSRPRHCNDNGLVECKNGAVIRKHMGYGYIAPRHAEAIGASYPNFRIAPVEIWGFRRISELDLLCDQCAASRNSVKIVTNKWTGAMEARYG